MQRSQILRNKLLWRCRQGTRELDTLLIGFVERQYDSLSEQERCILSELLEHRHDELNAWLINGFRPDDAQSASVVQKIRHDFESFLPQFK